MLCNGALQSVGPEKHVPTVLRSAAVLNTPINDPTPGMQRSQGLPVRNAMHVLRQMAIHTHSLTGEYLFHS